MSAREPQTLGGLAVRERESGHGWMVLHVWSGLNAIGGALRQKRFAEQARAELLATGVDFSQDARELHAQRDVWGPVYWTWRRRAERTVIDVETGEYYAWHVNYGQYVPSAAQAAAYRAAVAEYGAAVAGGLLVRGGGLAELAADTV
jgi:hypothetical protein